MKRYRKLIPVIFFLITVIVKTTPAPAQETKPTKEIITKNLVNNQQYVFYAQYVTPMTGQQRYLTTEYTLTVVKDTISCDLPYFGRAYSASLDPSDNGIKFTSYKFSYQVTDRKKGGWNVVIKPQDSQQVQLLNLTIFSDGTASLNVNSTNRQAISYRGYVAEKKLKK